MARQTKDKKRILIDQLTFNFEENIVEHYYKTKQKEENKEKIKTKFSKTNAVLKKSHKQKNRRR